MSREYYCRGCQRVVLSNTVGVRLRYLRHVREWGGCGFRVDERIKDDLNQRFMSKVGKALEEARREVERLQLDNVQLKADLVQLRAERDRVLDLQTLRAACRNCGYPTHGKAIMDLPEAPNGG